MSTPLTRVVTTALLLALLLTACGTRGPLYLPEEPAPEAEQTAEE